MPRTRQAYRLWLRGDTYYYRLKDGIGWKSTGCKTKTDATAYVLKQAPGPVAPIPERVKSKERLTLKAFLKPYFVEETCPHIARFRTEGKSIGESHIKAVKALLEQKVCSDSIADRIIGELRRGDFLSFRDRLRAQNGPRTVNRTMTALKTCWREALYREELTRDPFKGIGNIKYALNTSGTFTQDEIKAMFAEPPGPWPDMESWCFFLTMYSLGLRRGEALGLRWQAVDFEKNVVSITETLAPGKKSKSPKWGKTREVPLCEVTKDALLHYRTGRERVFPTDFIFADPLGVPYGHSWVETRFKAMLKTLGIDAKARHLRIHSMRHSAHSHLIAAGYSMELARAGFGWSDAAVQRGYTHLTGTDLAGQARILDALLK